MSWGHAVSRDLVHWQQLALALAETGGGDGLLRLPSWQMRRTPPVSGMAAGRPWSLSYTANSPEPQLQSSASPTAWIGVGPGPGTRQSRARPRRAQLPRPQGVLARADSALGHDRLVAGTADGALLLLTEPEALGTLSDFGPAGFPRQASGSARTLFRCPGRCWRGRRRQRWVLVVSVGSGAPSGGSGCQYFVGDFDGVRFAEDRSGRVPLWLDYGRDFYAAASWSGILDSDGRRLCVGWMSNWDLCPGSAHLTLARRNDRAARTDTALH